MFHKFCLIFAVFALSPIGIWNGEVAITYELNDGRFGDQLSCYLHAKWISYKYDVPFLYKPFLYSDWFALHEQESDLWTEERENKFDCVVRYIRGNIQCPFEGSLLYRTTFFSEQLDDLKLNPDWICFPIDWEDSGFRSLLKSLFSLRKEHLLFEFPKGAENCLTVAVHIRRGGDFDPEKPEVLWPLRFAPDSYYIECLKKVCHLFPSKPIYAFLFTDDPHPEEIALRFQDKLAGFPISFDFRKEGNRHDAHVMEDFFALMQFDCLIRCASNFTLIPTIIQEYKAIMTPKHHTWLLNEDDSIEHFIDEIDIAVRDGFS